MFERLQIWNEQLSTLAQAGVPLGLDLSEWGPDQAATIARIERVLSACREGGVSDEEAWEAARSQLPSTYAQVVDAGRRINNLDAVWQRLQNRSSFCETLTRRRTITSWLYPAFCVTLAYLGFLLLCWKTVPPLQTILADMQLAPGPVLSVLSKLSQSLPWWGPTLPALVVGFAAIRHNARPPEAHRSGPSLLSLVQRHRTTGHHSRSAQYASLLSLFHQHQLPLDEAIEMAAGITAEPALKRPSVAMAESLRSGQSVESALAKESHWPPLLRWGLAGYAFDSSWIERMDAVSLAYHHLANLHTRRRQIVVPMTATVVVGGTAALVYGLSLFLPLKELLERLAVSG